MTIGFKQPAPATSAPPFASRWRHRRHEEDFPVFPEGFFALKHDDLQPLPENNLLVFSEVYEALVQKKLEAAALEDVVRDLKAMYAEHDMERLIAALEHYRHYDDLIK